MPKPETNSEFGWSWTLEDAWSSHVESIRGHGEGKQDRREFPLCVMLSLDCLSGRIWPLDCQSKLDYKTDYPPSRLRNSVRGMGAGKPVQFINIDFSLKRCHRLSHSIGQKTERRGEGGEGALCFGRHSCPVGLAMIMTIIMIHHYWTATCGGHNAPLIKHVTIYNYTSPSN